MSLSTYDVAALRRDFPIFETGVAYLDSANTTQRPKQVIEAMESYFYEYNSNIHRSVYRFSEKATDRYEDTREKVRAFLNARSRKEIVYTRNTTEGINLVAYSWGRKNVGADDLIVTTIMEHHSNIHRSVYRFSERATDRYEDTREKVRAFLNAARARRSSTRATRPRASTWSPTRGDGGTSVRAT